MKTEIVAEAGEELREAVAYYEEIAPGLGLRLKENARMAIQWILAQLPRLTHQERRELVGALLALEEDASVLRDADLRADEHFLILDKWEAEDAPTTADRLPTYGGTEFQLSAFSFSQGTLDHRRTDAPTHRRTKLPALAPLPFAPSTLPFALSFERLPDAD